MNDQMPIIEDACSKAGLDLTPNCRQLINAVIKKFQPHWKGKDQDQFVMEVVFAIARIPYTMPKIETKILLKKVNRLNAGEIIEGFRNSVRMKLSDRELLQLSLIYIDAYEEPK